MRDESFRYLDPKKYIESGIFKKENIYFLPSIHARLEFGIVAALAVKAFAPDAIALELPAAARKSFLEGVARLPFISVMCVESDGPLQYMLVEPQDAMVSAVRSFGPDRQKSVHFIDHFCEGYREHEDRFPDPGAISVAGYEEYCGRYFESEISIPLQERDADDIRREQYMAASLQRLSASHGRVLFVCGMYHYPAIFRMLDHPNALPFVKCPVKKVYLTNLSRSSHRAALGEPGFLVADFERSLGTPAPSSRADKHPADNVIGFARRDPAGTETPSGGPRDRSGRRFDMSAALKAIDDEYPVEGPESLRRDMLHARLIRTALAGYRANAGSEIPVYSLSVMFKFLRNYMKIKGGLYPALYELVTAARGVADDNFAYELFETATEYPWIDESGRYASVEISLGDLKIGGKTITFHRRMKSMRQLFAPFMKARKREEKPGEWLREWKENSDFICSYQPEDIVIEKFGDFLRKKARSVLTDEQSRTEPFSTSLMDGIDMRETIRNHHVDGKLYVRIARHAAGKVGSVVFIFDDDICAKGGLEAYPYKTTWLGEHHQESDMAFYSTPPGEKIVGPGISRCEYGGFLLSYPPGRLYDVWKDPYYFAARTKPEVLLLAAIDYSSENCVVYCAKKPPRSYFKTIASRLGKKIVYVPMGQFSPQTIKKLQAVHVLAGKEVRKVAKDYIW